MSGCWQYHRLLLAKGKETSLSLLAMWEMSLQLPGVGEEEAAVLEMVFRACQWA